MIVILAASGIRGEEVYFDYNYTEDDLRTLDINRSALYEFRDLCQKLDSNNDGVADYSPPILKIDGVDETSSFDISLENICVSWVALSSGALDGKPGVAHYGSPGVHIRARDGQISSNIIAHEIGHNFGLLHEQRYNSHGEHIISDEGEKLARGNPYSVMGNAQEITNGSGDLSIASRSFCKNYLMEGRVFLRAFLRVRIFWKLINLQI